MNKSLISILIVFCLLAMFVGTVNAAPMASATATLKDVVYVTNKGAVFTFEVSGTLPNGFHVGSLHVNGGGDYTIHCNQIDAETVKCTAPKNVSDANVVIHWIGLTFWTYVPTSRFCYSVYDWNTPSPYTSWVNYGQHCQENQASNGDSIYWYNPGWGASFTYRFAPGSPACPWEHIGNAYYYPNCPG